MTPCANHPNRPNPAGYVIIRRDGVTRNAHRWAYIDAHGPIPDGLVVRHKCDNRRCVNVKHLELGTPAENAADMVVRGRSLAGQKNCKQFLTDAEWRDFAHRYAHGETAAKLAKEANMNVTAFARRAKKLNGSIYCGAKLNSVQAWEIRKKSFNGVSGKDLAAEYKTTPATISRILSRKIFRE